MSIEYDRFLGAIPSPPFDVEPHPTPGIRVLTLGATLAVTHDSVIANETVIPMIGSLDDLVGSLAALGIESIILRPDLRDHSVRLLIETEQFTAAGPGGDLYVFVNSLYVMLRPAGVALENRNAQNTAALQQLNLLRATGIWADLWGLYLGIPRQPNEVDAVYTARIKEETIRERLNNKALETILIAPHFRALSALAPTTTLTSLAGSSHLAFHGEDVSAYFPAGRRVHLIRNGEPVTAFVLGATFDGADLTDLYLTASVVPAGVTDIETEIPEGVRDATVEDLLPLCLIANETVWHSYWPGNIYNSGAFRVHYEQIEGLDSRSIVAAIERNRAAGTRFIITADFNVRGQVVLTGRVSQGSSKAWDGRFAGLIVRARADIGGGAAVAEILIPKAQVWAPGVTGWPGSLVGG